LARNFSSKKFINNAVESFFQCLLDLGGAGGAVCTMDKRSEELEPIIIRDRKLGNLALEMVPWCSEKMSMECRHVSAKVNGETRERLGQSAQRSAAVRGQAGRGATVEG
jgi:hypothetical protein